MTFSWLLARRGALAVEASLALIVLVSVYFAAQFLHGAGYLPLPYFYILDDTFMDWYNTAYFANNLGAYDVWRTIYPPLSFVFLRLFTIHSCYAQSALFARSCDWIGRYLLFGVLILNAILVYKSYRIADAKTALPRAVVVALGLPMLFTLDRGNLILPTFTFFVLGNSRLLRSARLKWLSLAIAINFKPYLLATLAPQFFRRRWRWFEGAAITCVLVYVFSFALEQAGTPAEIWHNISDYTDKTLASYVDNAFYGASFVSIIGIARSDFPLMDILGSRIVEIFSVILPIFIRIGQVGVLLSFVGAMIRPNAIPSHRLAALGVVFVISTIEVGGYAQVFLFYLLFFERWRGWARILVLVCAYLLSISWDYTLFPIAHQVGDSYWTGRTVGFDIGVNAGAIVRPALVLLIEYGLAAVSLTDIWRDWRASRASGGYAGHAKLEVQPA